MPGMEKINNNVPSVSPIMVVIRIATSFTVKFPAIGKGTLNTILQRYKIKQRL